MNDNTPHQIAREIGTASESSRSLVPTPGRYSNRRSRKRLSTAISPNIPQDSRDFTIYDAEIVNAPREISPSDGNYHAANESVSLDITASETATSNDSRPQIRQTSSNEFSLFPSDHHKISVSDQARDAIDEILNDTKTSNPQNKSKFRDKFNKVSHWHPTGTDASTRWRRETMNATPFWSHELHKLPFRR